MIKETWQEFIIGLLGCFILGLILAFLFGCSAQPYWKDGIPQSDPAIPNLSPSAEPIPQIGWQVYIVIGTVNIRSEPSTSSPSIGWLLPGAKVRADCNRSDGFCEVVGGYIIQACLGVGTGKCQGK